MYAVRNWLIGGIAALMLYLVPLTCQGAANVPDTINIDTIAKYYEGVKFDHAKHIQSIKDCADCHHHTTGTLFADRNCVRCHRNSPETAKVGCKACHKAEPFSAATLKDRDPKTYHMDKPGLKGAYHMTCVGCHKKMGAPTGCEDCHKLNQAGSAMYRTGEFAPKPGAAKGGHH